MFVVANNRSELRMRGRYASPGPPAVRLTPEKCWMSSCYWPMLALAVAGWRSIEPRFNFGGQLSRGRQGGPVERTARERPSRRRHSRSWLEARIDRPRLGRGSRVVLGRGPGGRHGERRFG
jgi:hypothetical protein